MANIMPHRPFAAYVSRVLCGLGSMWPKMNNARQLVESEIIYKMFPPASLDALDEKIESPSFSVHDYVATHLQQVFLPWPLSLLHLLPDWMILSGLIIIGLISANFF